MNEFSYSPKLHFSFSFSYTPNFNNSCQFYILNISWTLVLFST